MELLWFGFFSGGMCHLAYFVKGERSQFILPLGKFRHSSRESTVTLILYLFYLSFM